MVISNVLGVHSYTHDSSAALSINGRLVAYGEEERFSRNKGESGFPVQAITFCLAESGLTGSDIDQIIIPFRPYVGALRRLHYRLKHPSSFIPVMSDLLNKGRNINKIGQPLHKMGINGTITFFDHYLCHALSVFLCSPFEEAGVLIVDGVAEAWTGALFHAKRAPDVSLKCLEKIPYPHSIGLLFAAITEHLGFRHNRDEGTVMAMAALGDGRYCDDFKKLCFQKDTSFHLVQDYFDFGGTWTTPFFAKRFFEKRKSGEIISEKHFALARAVQSVTETICLDLAKKCLHQSKTNNLCFSGGIALNSVLNGIIARESGCDAFYVIPPGGDAGTSIGASLSPFKMCDWHLQHAFWGPGYSRMDIRKILHNQNIRIAAEGTQTIKKAAHLLKEGKIGGLFKGRGEMGPRALGHRSILADPRSTATKERLNDKIKKRASFRPFSPVMIKNWFAEISDEIIDSPFMLMTFHLPEKIKKLIPAVIHTNGSARIQTVTHNDDSHLYPLLIEFNELTGIPVLLNTSLNLKNEPIANSPQDAIRIFRKGGLDFLVLEDILIEQDNINYDSDY